MAEINKKLETYEYYFSVIDLMLNDMSNITLNDIQDAVDELHTELDKIKENEGEREYEMSADKTDRTTNCVY